MARVAVERDQERNALALLRQGRSDEAVERLAGLPLLRIIELRARLAAGPHRPGAEGEQDERNHSTSKHLRR